MRRDDRGMTLVETLVATVIATIAIGLITTLLITVQGTFRDLQQVSTDSTTELTVEDRIRDAWRNRDAVRAITRSETGGPVNALWFDFTDRDGKCLAMRVTPGPTANTVRVETGRYVTTSTGTVGTCTKTTYAASYVRWNTNVLNAPGAMTFRLHDSRGNDISTSITTVGWSAAAWDVLAYGAINRIIYSRTGLNEPASGSNGTLQYPKVFSY